MRKLDFNLQNVFVSDMETLHSHTDYNQVLLDVNRSLKRFPPGGSHNSCSIILLDIILAGRYLTRFPSEEISAR